MRETPQNIDRSVKLMEYAMAFFVPAILTFPMLELWAIVTGLTCCAVSIKFTAGKAPGFMEEKLYQLGLSLGELLPRNLTRLDS